MDWAAPPPPQPHLPLLPAYAHESGGIRAVIQGSHGHAAFGTLHQELPDADAGGGHLYAADASHSVVGPGVLVHGGGSQQPSAAYAYLPRGGSATRDVPAATAVQASIATAGVGMSSGTDDSGRRQTATKAAAGGGGAAAAAASGGKSKGGMMGGASRKAESPTLRCQVEGCDADLRKAQKDYHRRHKVCEMHSKAARVFKSGCEQRFCQQCSRFHAVTEFDDAKRSCRRRLEGHNKRRRKPSCPPSFLTSASSLLQLGYHDKLRQLLLHPYHQTPALAVQTPFFHDQECGTMEGAAAAAMPLIMFAQPTAVSPMGFGDVGGGQSSALSFLLHAQYRPPPGVDAAKQLLCTTSTSSITRGDVATTTKTSPSCALSLLSSHPIHHLSGELPHLSTAASAIDLPPDPTNAPPVALLPDLPHRRHNYAHLLPPPLIGDLVNNFDHHGPILTMSTSATVCKEKPFYTTTADGPAQSHYGIHDHGMPGIQGQFQSSKCDVAETIQR